MTLWQGLVLGLVQGLTEFIPISSTGHVTVAGRLLGLVDAGRPEQWTAFLAVVQLGTLAAVLAYFAGDIRRIIVGFVRANAAAVAARRGPHSFATAGSGQRPSPLRGEGWQDPSPRPGGGPVNALRVGRGEGRRWLVASEEDRRWAKLGWMVLAGTVPIAALGLALEGTIEGGLTKNLWVIAGSLIGVAVVLWVAEAVGRRARDMAGLRWWDAVVVGLCQVASLIPGASRSGTTIAGGLFAGLTRETAARFSFLLAIPAIGASGLYQLPEALRSADVPVATLVVAIAASAVSGWLAIAFLLRYLRRRSTLLFVVWRIGLGLALIWLLASGRMAAQ
ncbi:MAG: UDP-diphosphatase [SAR202 cluster bacterium]|nr:UDP-diphosphatase [SAR202 cluster bacterium]